MRAAAGLGLLALLVIAPLHYGSTRPGGIEWLLALGAPTVLLWAASLVVERRHPVVPAIFAGFAGLVLLAAVPWLTGLAQPTAVADFTREHFGRVAARWPDCLVWWNQWNQLGFIGLLVAVMVMAVDFARSPTWLLAMVVTITATGTAVAALAHVQNALGWKTIFGEAGPPLMTYFSGTFYHHTAAGAYLNSVWPLAFGLAWLSWRAGWRQGWTRGNTARTAAGVFATGLLLTAHGAHVSRLPQAVAALCLIALILVLLPRYGVKVRLWSTRRKLGVAFGLLALAGAAVLLVNTTGRIEKIADRWRALLFPPANPTVPIWHQPPEAEWNAYVGGDLIIHAASRERTFGLRQIACEDAIAAIRTRPWFGHGPANWIGAASRHSTDPTVRSFFQMLQFTHQDVLQFAVEWGLIGALGWWGLLAGGAVRLLRLNFTGRTLGAIEIGVFFALVGVLLQSQWDFPLQMPGIALNIAVLAGIAWSAQRSATAGVDSAATFAPFQSTRSHA